jgi:type II secretory pathway pseudopilin PulG
MKILLLIFLLAVIAMVSVGVLRRRREQRRAERAKALRAERLKARKRSVPHVSANLCGSGGPEHTAPMQRPPPSRAA